MRQITFITGPAGTGKSFKLREELQAERRPHLIVAPTGIAAVNVGGSTLHRTFKIHVDSGYVGKRWPEVQVVYIDEASMMGMTLFESALIGAPNAEFRLYGDMAQLPPVKDKYWFESKELEGMNVEIQKLTKQYRQQNDLQFTEVLNSIRNGTVTKPQLGWLYKNSTIDDMDQATTLAFRNDTVRMTNAERLLNIESELYDFTAQYTGVMKPSDCIAEQVLQLKVGAQVIMLNNDSESRWNNGTRAEVVAVDNFTGDVTVKINNNQHSVGVHKWSMKTPQELTEQRRYEIERDLMTGKIPAENVNLFKHFLATGIEYVVVGTCTQFPMKLAYSLTVHKSQGMTLDRVHVITSGFPGMHGIGYVALSRVRSLDTLSLDRKPTPTDFKFDNRLTNYV